MTPSVAPRGQVSRNEPLAPRTSWRVGGAAEQYFEPADREDLIAFVKALPSDQAIHWLGLGSNTLVRDGGVRGTVIGLHGALDQIALVTPAQAGVQSQHPGAVEGLDSGLRRNDGLIFAEAGVHCARLAKFAEREGLAGLGFMAGIPGTVGGALAMNAGAWGGETWGVVIEVEILRRDGSSAWLAASEFPHGYRQVQLPAGFCGFIAARFAVTADADGAHARATRESLAKRKASQPVGKPSAGSTFRNPPGDHAARLIESCGLKGHRIGGASVSTLHANFLITETGATAADVERLIEHVRATVKQKTGIELHPEVRIVGAPL